MFSYTALLDVALWLVIRLLLAAISLSGHRAGYKHDYLGYAPPIGEWTLADQKQIRSPPLYNPSHTRSISDFFFLQCPEGDGH